MELFEALQKRYSYRGRYLQTPVPRDHLLRILEAGLEAPSGCNKQTTSLIAVMRLISSGMPMSWDLEKNWHQHWM